MKKRLILALLLVSALLALCACSGRTAPVTTDDSPAPATAESAPVTDADASGSETADAPALTMRDVLDANSAETLFQTYGGVLRTYDYPNDPDRVRVEYLDAEVLFFDSGSEQDLLFYDGSSGYLRDDEGYGALMDFNFDPSYYAYPTLDEALTAQEEIVSVAEDGGAIFLTTRLSAEAYRPYYPDGDFPYDDGDYFEESYRLDASDRRVLEMSEALVHADGSREEQYVAVHEYGAARPEIVAEMLARKNADDPRTGTVTLDPGTPDERTMSATAQKGDYIYFIVPQGYETLYVDPECTIERTPDDTADLNADFHLYGKAPEA